MGWFGMEMHRERVRWRIELAAIAQIDAARGRVEFSPHKCRWITRYMDQEYRTTVGKVNLRQVSGVDRMLPILESFPNLERLWLRESDVTDEGLSHIRNHPTLTGIELADTAITDIAIDHLCSIPRLQDINLGSTRISSRARKKLQRAFPSGWISHYDAVDN